jgi:hypothetical protein
LYEFFDLLGVLSERVQSTGETVQDGDDIGNKLLVWAEVIKVLNHDLAIMGFA